MRVKPILGIFAVASGTIFLTACDDRERASGDGILRALGVTTSVPEQASFGIEEVPAEPAPECKIVGNEWRTHYCENGVKLAYP